MGHTTPSRFARSRCGSELLPPFAGGGTLRLSGTAAWLATLLRRAGAQSPRRAAAGLLRHAGSAALLAATRRAWTSALLDLRRRPTTLLGATTALLRAWTSALLDLRRRPATLLGATTALLRAWTSALLDLRRRPTTLLGATTALLRAWTSALLDLRRRPATLLGATTALLRRARTLALLGAASTLWRHNGSALLRPRGRGWLLAARLATRLGGRLTSLFRRRARPAFRARPSLFRTTGRLALLRRARRARLLRLLRRAGRTRPWWLLHGARSAGRLRSLRCAWCTWPLTPRLGRSAGSLRLLCRARCRRARLLRLAGGSRRVLPKPTLLAGAQRCRRRNVLRGLNGCLPLLGDRDLHALPLRRAHLDGVRHAKVACEHWRPYLDRHQRTADRRRNELRLDPGIDRDALAFLHDGPVHDHRLADEHVVFARRQDHVNDARRQAIAITNEDPHLRPLLDLDQDLVGRQRRPADAIPAAAPIDPAGTPLVPRDPDPAQVGIEHPAAVMERDPAPILLVLRRDPVPAPFLGVRPVPVGVGPPIARPVDGQPHLAPSGMPLPSPVWVEHGVKIDRDGGAGLHLGRSRAHGTIDQQCAADDGNGGHASKQGKRGAAGHVSHGIALEVVTGGSINSDCGNRFHASAFGFNPFSAVAALKSRIRQIARGI